MRLQQPAELCTHGPQPRFVNLGTLNKVGGGPSRLHNADAGLPNEGPVKMINSGTINFITGGNLTGAGSITADVDATHNNVINITDFNVLKGVFGTASSVGDLNNDGVTNVTDFTLLKGNFGQAGAAINCP